MTIWERGSKRQDGTNPQKLKYVLRLTEATRELTEGYLVALIGFIEG